MSGTPNCAIMLPSRYSTIEWTIDWGWMRTSIFEGGSPKSQVASITSSPLFIRVAESTVIFVPIRHVGCPRASETVAFRIRRAVWFRNGPPEAVRIIRRMSSRRWPEAAWNTAECSLSTGRISAPPARAASTRNAPPATSSSLLARAIRFPRAAAAMTGRIDEIPDAAASTISAGEAQAASVIPSSPNRTRVPRGRRPNARAVRSSARQTSDGRNFLASSPSRFAFVPAHSAVTRNLSGNRPITSRALRPTEPVAPRTAIPFLPVIPYAPPGLAGNERSEVEHRPRGDQRVRPVEQPAVSRQERAAVLYACRPLEHRLEKVSRLSDGSEDRGGGDDEPGPDAGQKDGRVDRGDEHAARQAADRPFDRLVRGDPGRQRGFSERTSHEVGERVPGGHRQDPQQDPVLAARKKKRPRPGGKESSDIRHP